MNLILVLSFKTKHGICTSPKTRGRSSEPQMAVFGGLRSSTSDGDLRRAVEARDTGRRAPRRDRGIELVHRVLQVGAGRAR